MELSAKEMENKSKDWVNEIKSFKNDQIQQITDNFEKSMTKLRDEVEDSHMNITRLQFKLDEEIQKEETLRNKLEVNKY